MTNHVCIKNGTVVVDGQAQIENGAVILNDGLIEWVGTSDEKAVLDWEHEYGPAVDAAGAYVCPGFVDVHIHGAQGKDLIEGTQEAVDAVSRDIVKDGCTSFFASLTVLSHQETCDVIERLSQCHSPEDGAHFIGIHAEGPFLSPAYKALMIEEYLRDPNIQEMDDMIRAGHGKLKYMTLAPERSGSEDTIRYAKAHGVEVMLGHTNARVADVKRAYLAGARGFTHLYNAMSQHTHRDPGTVTAALLSRNMIAELICDGFHVDPYVVQATYAALGSKRIALITDAMLGKGMPDGEYTFSKLNCVKVGKTVTVKETGRISGSCIGMNDAIARMHRFTGCSICDLVQMACVNPSILANMNQRIGTLERGKDADVVILDADLQVRSVYVSGKAVYQAGETA